MIDVHIYIYFSKLGYLSGDIYLFFLLVFRPSGDSQKSLNWNHLQVGNRHGSWSFKLYIAVVIGVLLLVLATSCNISIYFMSWTTAPGMFKSNCLGSIAWIAGFICSETLPGLLGLLLPVETQAATDSLDELHGGSSPRFQPGTTTWTLPRTTNTVRTSAISTTIWMPCSESMTDQAAQRVDHIKEKTYLNRYYKYMYIYIYIIYLYIYIYTYL